ncbi:MAG: hypothetical protein IJP01_01130, partial [Oscillospiraceae bacterium]|nr:hypothetical protein [Oscillospiraceae bacterium]
APAPRPAAPAVRPPAAAPAPAARPVPARPVPAEDIPPWETAPLPTEAPPAEMQLPEPPAQHEPAPVQPKPAAAPAPAAEPAASGDLLASWPQVLDVVRQKSRMLGMVLAKSRAHVTDTHLLIEASDMAIKFIRENADSRQVIKDAVLQVSGLRLPVGPWKAPAAAKADDGDDGLEAFLHAAEQAGVEVTRK